MATAATGVVAAAPVDFPSLDTPNVKGTRDIEKLMHDFATAHGFSYYVRHPKKEPGYVRFACAACSNVRDPAASTSKRRKTEPTGDSNDSQSSTTVASALPRIHAVRIGYTPQTGAIDKCWVESAHWTHRCGIETQPVQQPQLQPVEPVAASHVQLLVNLMHSRLDYAILSLKKSNGPVFGDITISGSTPYEHLVTFQVHRAQINPLEHGRLVNIALTRLAEMPSTAGRAVTDVAVVTDVVEKVYNIEKKEETEFVFLKFFIKLAKS